MADSLLYEISNITDAPSEPFTKKDLAYVTDNNNGAYNGQIEFVTSNFANSGKWASYNEAYIIIPLVVGVKSTVDITGYAGPNGFMVNLKNGFHQLIDQIQVEYNNVNVVQPTPFTNFYVSYKLMTSFSQEDLIKYGSALNFFPDSSSSFQYNVGASTFGNGISNNIINPLTAVTYATASYKGETHNSGLLRRCMNLGYDPTAGFGGAWALYTSPLTTGKSYFTNNGGAGPARIYYLNILAKIRLKDICDFFDKIPLVKGGLIKLNISTNTSIQTVTTVSASGNMSIATATDYTITGRTNPLLITSSATLNPMNVVCGTIDKNFTIGCGIGSVTLTGTTATHNILTSCRLYVPLYTMNPTFEVQYLKLNPTKTTVYRDIVNYNILNVGAGASLTTTLSNGITNAKTLIVIPILNGSTAGNNATVLFAPHQSPFTTEPATTSPLLAIQNFNVAVAGLNLFQNNQQYDFCQFMDELKSINAVNGGVTTGLTSGLVGEFEFSNAYRYYVADISRGVPQDESNSRSVQVLGNNASTKIVDYYCFVEIEKSFTVETISGKLLETKP